MVKAQEAEKEAAAEREAQEAAASAEAMAGNGLASFSLPPVISALRPRDGPPVVGLRELPKTLPVAEVVKAMREVSQDHRGLEREVNAIPESLLSSTISGPYSHP